MKMIKTSVFILLIFFGFLPEAIPQADCALSLRNAQELYNSGKIEGIPALLQPCMESGFTRDERIQAYKLIINASIFDSKLQEAEEQMLGFLRKYPDYKTVATDPAEFVNLYNMFDNNPRYSLGLQVGINASSVRVGEKMGPYALSGIDKEYSADGVSFQAGAVYFRHLSPILGISVEPMYRQSKFNYEVMPYGFANVKYIESQGLVDLPVSVVLDLPVSGKLIPYVRAGAKTSYLIFANSSASREYLNTGDVKREGIDGAQQSKIKDRNINNYYLIAGGGLKYQLPKSYLFVDFRYNFNLLPQVREESRNNGQDEDLWLFYLVNDTFYLDDFSINLGIARTFYNPKSKLAQP